MVVLGLDIFTMFRNFTALAIPVVIAPLFNKYEPIKDESLKEKITSLMAQVGLKAKGFIRLMRANASKHTNAYFTGIGKTKRIVLI